ncbi:MAG TPA: polyhydroxyalkanoate synthesis regulator DNA-binding domain-containing protein [Anaerolineae bacterium]|nr:polyhydroxyalkanoate synthesis regulator DNA-binding domain-containing protein [Anaerolineae bacterium]
MRVVKRYPNRKLYDTQSRRYITLSEIGAFIQAGEEVQVVDNQTGDDLTDITLTQVIVARARRQATTLPRSVLAHLIGAGSFHSGSWREQIEPTIERLRADGELSAAGADQLRDLVGRSPVRTIALPGVVERQMEATLRRMNLPSKSDMLCLRSRLDDLARQLEGMEQQKVKHKDNV